MDEEHKRLMVSAIKEQCTFEELVHLQDIIKEELNKHTE